MVMTPFTGYENEPDRFHFSSARLPPDAVLPPAIRKLAAEFRDHHVRWRESQKKHRELSSPQSLKAAKRADEVLLGEAVRGDKELPGHVNEQALEQALEAEAETMARHEAAGRLIVQDIETKLKAAAEKAVTDARSKIDQARKDHADALAALETARNDLVANTAGLAYWQSVVDTGGTRWKGRTDGQGVSIIAVDGRHVKLERFAQMTADLAKEADRLAAAVHPPDPDAPTSVRRGYVNVRS